MEDCRTPEPNRQFTVPPTPFMTQIGYGTGVSVYHLERSPRAGKAMSPWAVKKVMKKFSPMSTYSDRMTKEANILRRLTHPNIIGFRGFTTTEDGRKVLAMEECTVSLGDLIENNKEAGVDSFEPMTILKVIESVAQALDYLHTDCGLIHGDIKSHNVLVKGNFDEVKICDFGVSLKLDDKGEAPFDEYVGTSAWSAPETFDSGPVTAKSDIFSLGLTIWEMLTFEIPFVGGGVDDSNASFEDMDNSIEIVFGQRPELPALSAKYAPIVDLYNWSTEADYKKRPTAKEILDSIRTLQ